MAKESRFQADLKKELLERFPGCVVKKMSTDDIQGFPDLLVLHGDRWALLECKRSVGSTHRPNQDHYVSLLDEMSYASFIYPENKESVLDDLQAAFGSER